MTLSSITYKLGRKIYLSGTYGKFTSRKIYDVCKSSAGFDVIIGEKEFELKSGKTRFTEDERKILITIVKDTISRSAPNDVYYEEDGEDKIYYHFYKDNNGDIYLVGVKYFKTHNIGFFETVYKTDIRNSHKGLKKLGDKK